MARGSNWAPIPTQRRAMLHKRLIFLGGGQTWDSEAADR